VLLIARDTTEQKRSQDALWESGERYKTLFESSPESIILISPDGSILQRNKAAAEISGLREEQVIGKSFADLRAVPEEELVRFMELFSRVVGGEDLGPAEGRVIGRDGEIRWIEAYGVPLRKKDEIYAVQIIARDVTERKRFEMSNTVLRDLGLALSTASDLREGLRVCLEAALKASALDCGAIYLLDEVSGGLDMVYQIGLSPEFVKSTAHYDAGTLNAELVMAGSPVYSDYQGMAVVADGTDEGRKIRAVAVLPIKCEGRVIGCINVASHSIEDVPAWSRASLETISTEIGRAIMRLRAEQAHRKSENRFRSLTENAPDYIVQVDREGNILFTNRTYEGVSFKEVIGSPILTWVPEQYHSRFRTALDLAFDSEEPQIVEYSAPDGQGKMLWYSAKMGPVSDEHGVVASAILVIRDLTERRTAERALREREARFRAVFDNASHGMALTDLEGRLTHANDRFQTMLGYRPGELIGKRVMDLTHPDDLEISRTNLRMLLDGTLDSYRIEKRYLRKDGTPLWVDLSVRSLSDSEGEIESLLGIMVDITERKRAEEALRRGEEQIRRYSEDLEEMVRERTARIHQLEHRRAESEKLAATGRMAARIAHEINNPLAGIKNSFLLLKDIMDKGHPHYEYAERVESEIDRIAGIVRRMFELYRPDRNGAVEVSIGKVIADVVAILESTSRAAEVAVSLDVPEQPIKATLPSGYVNQVMFNLIRNAIEASEAGDMVGVSASVEGDTAVVRVRDEGRGIPEETGDRVFEPFFTTKDSTTVGGLGLGLSVSKGMVEMMGGSIAFESMPDKGSTFTVTLPIRKRTEEI
jgi:two-component system sporulation sensor kinase C